MSNAATITLQLLTFALVAAFIGNAVGGII